MSHDKKYRNCTPAGGVAWRRRHRCVAKWEGGDTTMAAGGGSFTLEEAAYLRSLSAVSEVSPVRITYSEEFKRSCVRRYKAGESPARIFREAGLDPSLIGYKRIERCVARWKASGKYADASEQADDAPQDAGADETPGVDSITTDERKYDNWLNGQSLSAADIAFASLRRRGGVNVRALTCATLSSTSRCITSERWNAKSGTWNSEWRRYGRCSRR